MTIHRLERAQLLRSNRAEVFSFFEDATNLARLTPAFLNFTILTKTPIPMHEGTLIDYRIQLFGIPLRWRTEIEVYERGVRFVDRQIRGPYKLWRHTHTFADVSGGTLMTDRVDYALGFGPLGSAAHELFVRATLKRIFDYRAEVVASLFGPSNAPEPGARGGASLDRVPTD